MAGGARIEASNEASQLGQATELAVTQISVKVGNVPQQ
jgi:hypothetical protein